MGKKLKYVFGETTSYTSGLGSRAIAGSWPEEQKQQTKSSLLDSPAATELQSQSCNQISGERMTMQQHYQDFQKAPQVWQMVY